MPTGLPPDAIARLAAFDAGQDLPAVTTRQAAVAALLRGDGDEAELLLMRRAERAEDRWSGQVSLPGGKAEPSDPDLFVTAIRETQEELGVDLSAAARPLCRLERVGAMARGEPVQLSITPWVFEAREEITLDLGPEAVDAFWLPLGPAVRGELDDEVRYERDGLVHRLPAWRVDDHVVWGLTHRMIRGVLAVCGVRL